MRNILIMFWSKSSDFFAKLWQKRLFYISGLVIWILTQFGQKFSDTIAEPLQGASTWSQSHSPSILKLTRL